VDAAGVVVRGAALAATLALAACASLPLPPARPTPTPATPTARYEPVAGRTPEVVARLRAEPAPAEPEESPAGNPQNDEDVQGAQGYVRIGSARFVAADADAARAQARHLARGVGADRFLLYAPATAGGEWSAAYYARLRLPFGAEFRDLTEAERAELGADGVCLGVVIGGTPAAAANLRSGDLVLRFNHLALRDKAAFQALLQSHQGRRVVLTIRRDGAVFDRLVRLGTLDDVNK
jgi:hypothetical protein